MVLPSFAEVFEDLTGHRPREYQERLADQMVAGRLPSVLDVPTGMGKTLAVLVGWLYALAVDANAARTERRQRGVALRLHFVVDRRVVVDDTYRAALKLQAALTTATDGPVSELASALQRAFDIDSKEILAVCRLRGGLLEDDAVTEHTHNPAQPTIVVGTLDMVCSRLLFRGYGLSAARRPVDAALTGLDSWWVLDEAHLAEQARTTLDLIASKEQALESRFDRAIPPLGLMAMTATAMEVLPDALRIDWVKEEQRDSSLAVRRRARNQVPLTVETVAKADVGKQIQAAAAALVETLRPGQSVVVYCNTVFKAKQTFAKLAKAAKKADVQCKLFVGGMPTELTQESVESLTAYRTGAAGRSEADPVLVVATSTLEVGADLDFTHLVTESCNAGSLVQRLGRVNRVGSRDEGSARVIASDAPDPVHGSSAQEVAALLAQVETVGEAVDLLQEDGQEGLWPDQQVPVLIPPTVFRSYARTVRSRNDLPVSPWIREVADPRAEGVVVVREHLTELAQIAPDALSEYLLQRPPDRDAEGWSLPMSALREVISAAAKDGAVVLIAPDAEAPQVLERIDSRTVIPAGSVVLIDTDCAWKALGVPGAQRDWSRCRVQLGGSLKQAKEALSQAVESREAAAGAGRAGSPKRRKSPGLLVDLSLDQPRREDPTSFLEESVAEVEVPHGWVLQSTVLGASSAHPCLLLELTRPVAEEKHRQVTLDAHGQAVAEQARRWATALGLPKPMVADIQLAGQLHDEGKGHSEAFQRALVVEEDSEGHLYLGAPAEKALAKSALPSRLWRRAASFAGVPVGWRHEAASAEVLDRQLESGAVHAHDEALVRHLILSHHGGYRGPGPVVETADGSASYQDANSPQWAEAMSAFWHLNDRYGPYTLALAETILRLADWEVSRREQADES